MSPTVSSRPELDGIPDDELGSFLVQDGGEPVGSPLFEHVITVPADEETEAPVDVTLWEAGEVSGPVVIEVTSTLALESGDVLPIQDAINYGTMVWFEPVGIVYGAAAAAVGPEEDTVIVVSRQIGLTLHSIEAASNWVIDTTLLAGQTSTVRLLDPSASEHGFGIQWEYSGEEVSHGFEPDLDDPTCVDFWYRCAPLPGQEGRRAHGPLAGTIEVRVYEAEQQEPLTLELSADTTELHPWIRYYSPLPPAPFVQEGRLPGDAALTVTAGMGGAPLEGQEVSLRAEFVKESGGHAHVSSNVDIADAHLADYPPPVGKGKPVLGMFVQGGDTTTAVAAETGSSGELTVGFVAGFVGGDVDIIASTEYAGATIADTVRIQVAVPDLVALNENSIITSNALMIGRTTYHPNGDNWHATAEFATRVQAMVQVLSAANPGHYLQLNDASLPLGGAFTVTPPPTNGTGVPVEQPGLGHGTHALGIDEDISWCYATSSGVPNDMEAEDGVRIHGLDCAGQGTVAVSLGALVDLGFAVLVEGRGGSSNRHYHIRLEGGS